MKYTSVPTRHKQAGFGLTEIVIGAVIAAILGAVLYNVFAKQTRTNEGSALAADITKMTACLYQGYKASGTFTGLANATLGTSCLQPSMERTGAVIATPYGNLTVAVNAADATRFDTSVAGLDDDECSELGKHFAAAQNRSVFVSMTINGGANVTSQSQVEARCVAGAGNSTLVLVRGMNG